MENSTASRYRTLAQQLHTTVRAYNKLSTSADGSALLAQIASIDAQLSAVESELDLAVIGACL